MVAEKEKHTSLSNKTGPTEVEINKKWKRYKRRPTVKLRNELAMIYMPLVYYHASKYRAGCPKHVQLCDLVSHGSIGLLDAIEKFDPDRGFGFNTYSKRRICGAIYDGVRNDDWVPRLTRQRAKMVGDATDVFLSAHGRMPNGRELANEMRVTQRESRQIAGDADGVGVLSLSHKWFDTDSGRDVRQIDVMVDEKVPDPSDAIGESDELRHLMRGLDRAERLVLIHRYCDGLTMRETGKSLGLSESMVSIMHARLVDLLRDKLTSASAPCGQ